MASRTAHRPQPVGGALQLSGAQIDDTARLTALQELDLDASNAPEAIDRLTRLAAEFLEVPVSLVTLVGDERQVFLGMYGLVGEPAETRQTPLSHSICKYVTSARAPLIVADARADSLLQESPAVEDLEIVAYAGTPLILETGEAVGAFCAIDFEPHEWSRDDLRILEDFGMAATEILNQRAALVERSLHDRLTGLPNRELLVASCDELLAAATGGEKVAVVCAGIDHFNMVNQALGAEKADWVLRAVAERLAGSVRDTDIFGRLRGDVFALVAPEIPDELEALKLASRIHLSLSSEPLRIENEQLSVGVTLGIALATPGTTGSDLVSEAANAMREAKRSQGRVRIAETDRGSSAIAQLRLRDALHGACERDEIRAVFQPIMRLEEERRVVGYEALARWTNPDVGEVSPGDFIPIAELTSEIIPIGQCMLSQVAAFASELRDAKGEELRVTLNVSPLELDQSGFAEAVREAFESEGLGGGALGIEITEGTLLESGAREEENIATLRDFGARVLLDDFGTGYSSLGYLRDFQIDTIKIDRSFVAKMTDDHHSAALIQAILAMARGLEMEVVAEGVETEEQAKLLRLLGCRYGQGFGLGRPGGAAAALAMSGEPHRSNRL